MRFYHLYLILFSSGYFLTALEDSLSMMLKTGLKPLLFKYVMFSFNVANLDVSFDYFTGFASMSVDDQSYSTKISIFPLIDLIENFLVKSM